MPGEEIPGEDLPGGHPHGEDDDDAGGLPPHPLDRAWFHPSELSSYMASAPPERRRRQWTLLAMAGVAGAVITLGVLAGAGTFDGDGSGTTAVTGGALSPAVNGIADPVERVVAVAGASVVTVSLVAADPALRAAGPSVVGSGVAVGRNRVLTSASLVHGDGTMRVTTSAGHVFDGRLAGVDPDTDLALVHVADGDLRAASLGDAQGLRVGQPVITLGSAGGDHQWTGHGVIAALDRVVDGTAGVLLAALIETDVDIADSATGGALVDEGGRVIGILSGAAHGRAIPIDVARDVADQLAASGRAHHGWLGIGTADAADHEGGGARIVSVVAGGPAAAAGFGPGDVITSVGTERITDTPDLMAAMLRRKPGDPVAVVAARGDRRVRKQVPLGERASAAATMGGP